MDNIFVERLWRSLKYEEVYLHAYATVAEAKAGIGAWLDFYNTERQHQSLGYCTPRQVYQVPTYPQALQSTKRLVLMLRKAEALYQPLHRQ